MKKVLKIFLFVFLAIFILLLGLSISLVLYTSDVKLDLNKVTKIERSVTYYDCFGTLITKESLGTAITDVENIPDHVKNAFIAIEDKRFYNHNGVDIKGLFRATLNNVKSFSFKEGASTITQQLIKNTHLSNEKTLKRKISEIKLSLQLEKKYDKDSILESYLNTIYFGNNCYGITSASKYYFGKQVENLTINEGATLAGIIKAPTNYSPKINMEKCFERKNLVLKRMFEQDYISESDYNKLINEKIVLCSDETFDDSCLYFAKNAFSDFLNTTPYDSYDYKVYTTLDLEKQRQIDLNFNNVDKNCEKSYVLFDKNNRLTAFNSSTKLQPRQLGSILKPILVYAPAIETDTIASYTKINDEKTNFNGYSPSNYNNKYYGLISVKQSLAKSLNTCAVKILNDTGIEKSKSFAKKVGINFAENDNSLCLALGAMENGVYLNEITASYNVFLNGGIYFEPKYIDRICDGDGKVLFNSTKSDSKVFSSGTVDVMNDMLNYTTTDGTAKVLKQLNFPVYSKTGTVGDDNGNYDAYNVSYTNEYLLGVWFGSKDYNQKIDNKISGGTYPTYFAKNVWENMLKNNNPKAIEKSNETTIISLDKISYEDDDIIELADELSPKRYNLDVLAKNSFIPKNHSTRFSNPKIEKPILSVNNREINIKLCLTEYYEIELYLEKDNNEKVKIYDTLGNNKAIFTKTMNDECSVYKFYAIPYYLCNNTAYKGEEIYIGSVKIEQKIIDDSWWEEDDL